MTCDDVCKAEFFIFFFAFCSTFLYMAFLLTIFKNRHTEELGNGFFRITFMLGVADLVFIWCFYLFGYIPRQLGISVAKIGGSFVGRIALTMQRSGRTGQILGVLLLAFNRLIVVFRPMDYDLVCLDQLSFLTI